MPTNPFGFDLLRRHPDVEGPNLLASDATDRLILEEAGDALRAAAPGTVVVLGDRYGALTLGAAAWYGVTGVRVHQDALSGERALAANAERFGLGHAFTSHPLDESALAGARVVLAQLPRSLDELDEMAALIAAHAHRDVRVFAGGRVKHMARAMNDVLGRHFAEVRASLAQQKSRVLLASGPATSDQRADAVVRWPVSEHHGDLGLTVCAHGGVFAGTRIDIGTRALAELVPAMTVASTASCAVDLGSGSGVLAVLLAKAYPDLRVVATDDSAAAVASTLATSAANGLGHRIEVVQDDGASHLPDGSADLVVLNPPFHIGASVSSRPALRLFAEAGRVLRPGGELWTVWNSHLMYRPALERLVGPTRQAARNTKFTVTVSTRA